MSNEVNIYQCKDGRTRAYIKSTKKVVSYPRLLLEKKLGRKLLPNEQVHHKDENPLNNDLDNLEVKFLGEHQKEHGLNKSKKYKTKITRCLWCGKDFIWSIKKQYSFFGHIKRKTMIYGQRNGPFCSKVCSGKYGAYIQNKYKYC